MKKILSIMLALLLVLSAVSFAEEAQSKIVVALYAEQGMQEAWDAVAEGYEALHPEVDVVVDLKPQESYTDWVKALFASENPEADIVYANLAGSDRNNKTINFYDYMYDVSPYSGKEWWEQFNIAMQDKHDDTGMWDNLSLLGVQVLWFYNADIFQEVGLEPPTTWDEFVTVCEKLEAAGYQALAVPGTYQSFWANQLGWLAQIYVDQTTRSQIELVRAQPGDWCYDEEIDGVYVYDPTDPHNDDTTFVTNNGLRFYQLFRDGVIRADSEGHKAVWTNFAKLFPKYAGGENFFGTDKDGMKALFMKGEAAIWLDGSWFFSEFLNTMDTATDESGIKYFNLGTFVMPSMEGEAFEAPARTIEVATGFLGAVQKDAEHDELVVDFLKYYSSSEGFGKYYSALLVNGGGAGLPLVYDVAVTDDRLITMFQNINYIGNCQKGLGQALARGLGDDQEATRNWYTYSQDFLEGKITVEEWAAKNQENQYSFLGKVIAANGINPEDLDHPENEATGK